MEKIYLSKRDIMNLLGKLDSVRDGAVSTCTIIKNDVAHPVYPQSLRRIAVMATEVEDRYLPGVSPRLHVSRQNLISLLEQMTGPLTDNGAGNAKGTIPFDGLELTGVPDEAYYVDRSETDVAPVGDLAAGFFRNRGKHR